MEKMRKEILTRACPQKISGFVSSELKNLKKVKSRVEEKTKSELKIANLYW